MSRLFVCTTDPESGSPKVDETEMAMTKTPLGHSVGLLMVQKTMEPEPQDVPGMVGQKADSGNFSQKDGISWVTFEFPPGLDTKFDHFANALTYTIVTHGELDVDFVDGTTQKLKQGDVFVNAASIHRWVNRGAVPAKAVGVATLCKPVKVNGKTLDQPPYSATKMG